MFLLLVDGELAAQPPFQEPVLQPQPLFGVRDVRELGADGAAVDVLELRDDFAQLQPRRQLDWAAAGEKLGVEVGIGQAEVPELEHPRPFALQAQRIDVGDQVAAVGVDLDQPRNRALLGGGIGTERP